MLTDIVNCFDQLNESTEVIIKKSDNSNNIPRKVRFSLNNKVKIFNFFIPPLISIFSLVLLSSTLIYIHNPLENEEKNELINLK